MKSFNLHSGIFFLLFFRQSLAVLQNKNAIMKETVADLLEDFLSTCPSKEVSLLYCYHRYILSNKYYQTIEEQKDLDNKKITQFTVASESQSICFAGRYDAPGSFTFNLSSGRYRIRLRHVSGAIGCTLFPSIRWPLGCKYHEAYHTILISNLGKGSVIIQNSDFTLHNGHGADTTIISTEDYFDFEKDRQYSIWYEEDYYNDSEWDNKGSSCVMIFGIKHED